MENKIDKVAIVAIVCIAIVFCTGMFMIAKSNDDKMNLYDKMQSACNWVQDIDGNFLCTTRDNLE